VLECLLNRDKYGCGDIRMGQAHDVGPSFVVVARHARVAGAIVLLDWSITGLTQVDGVQIGEQQRADAGYVIGLIDIKESSRLG